MKTKKEIIEQVDILDDRIENEDLTIDERIELHKWIAALEWVLER